MKQFIDFLLVFQLGLLVGGLIATYIIKHYEP